MSIENENPTPVEEQLNEEELSRVEEAMENMVRRRGASKPCGAFARSDWFWTWSKGADLLDAVCIDAQPKPEGYSREDLDKLGLELSRARLGYEVDEICEAASWNISEYRKIYGITVAELANAIEVSESTLRKKLNDGTLTLKEFLTLCAVCLTDPCVMLGYVDSEDARLVQGLHHLDKASDHRAVRELVEILSTKQAGRTMIRKSVSPIIEADLGWDTEESNNGNAKSDVDWDAIRRELLPSWPLWWETGFDYAEFNALVEAYLSIVNHGRPETVTYEMKADAASKIVNLTKENPEIISKFNQYKALKTSLSELRINGNELQVESLEKLAHDLFIDFARSLLKATGDRRAAKEDEE